MSAFFVRIEGVRYNGRCGPAWHAPECVPEDNCPFTAFKFDGSHVEEFDTLGEAQRYARLVRDFGKANDFGVKVVVKEAESGLGVFEGLMDGLLSG